MTCCFSAFSSLRPREAIVNPPLLQPPPLRAIRGQHGSGWDQHAPLAAYGLFLPLHASSGEE